MGKNGGGDISHQHAPGKQFQKWCSRNRAHFLANVSKNTKFVALHIFLLDQSNLYHTWFFFIYLKISQGKLNFYPKWDFLQRLFVFIPKHLFPQPYSIYSGVFLLTVPFDFIFSASTAEPASFVSSFFFCCCWLSPVFWIILQWSAELFSIY